MSITIGRVGSDGIELPDPEISYSGSQVSLSGKYTPDAGSSTAVADTLWLREQLLGLVGNDDDPIVPVVWSTRPEFGDDLDGYYRVGDVQVSLPQAATNSQAPFLEWSVSLDRITDYRQPRMEVFGVYGLVSNGLGLSGDIVVGVPQVAIDWWPDLFGGSVSANRSTPDGDVQLFVHDSSSATGDTFVSRLAIPPPYYYIGACGAEYDIDGGPTWRKVVGRRAFTTAEIAIGNAVRISNGLVRVQANATQLLVSWYDGTSWSTATPFALWETVTYNLQLRFIGGRVLLSSPTEVVLRLGAIVVGHTEPFTVDLRLRRGIRDVFGRVGGISQGKFSVRFFSSTASTSLTGGLRRTSNNSSGDREILISDTMTTKDTTNGSLTDPTFRTSALFGIGCEVNGSSASFQNTAANQVQEWFMSVSETQRVVAG